MDFGGDEEAPEDRGRARVLELPLRKDGAPAKTADAPLEGIGLCKQVRSLVGPARRALAGEG